MKNFFRDKKNIVILLLGALVAIGITGKDTRFLWWILTGVSVAASADLAINRFFLKRNIIPKSAIITGFIVAGVIDYREPWFLVVVFPLLAIISKYIVRYKKKHIFNPANLALFTATVFNVPLTWNIESNIYLIILIGLYLAYSIKKIPHVAGFLGVFIALFVLQGVHPFMLVSWFFVFIMLIEPKTSGFGLSRGLIFGSIAGLASFLIFKFSPIYDLFISSLFVANFFNPFLGRIKI